MNKITTISQRKSESEFYKYFYGSFFEQTVSWAIGNKVVNHFWEKYKPGIGVGGVMAIGKVIREVIKEEKQKINFLMAIC